MNARRDLLGELPILAQITAPSTDADAYLPVHPGAAAFYNGTQESFLDKWGNIIFLAPMIVGALVSVLAAAWKFLRAGDARDAEQALDALYALGRRIRRQRREAELSEIEREIDKVLQAQREKAAAGDENALDVTTLNVAAHRLENLIHDRRTLLAARPGGKAMADQAEPAGFPIFTAVRGEPGPVIDQRGAMPVAAICLPRLAWRHGHVALQEIVCRQRS